MTMATSLHRAGTLLFCMAALSCPGAGWADDTSLGNFSGVLGIVSDYVDRGVSQSDSHAAVQAELAWQFDSGIYAALWGSTVHFDDGNEATTEVNYVLGIERELGNGEFGVSVAYIDYPGVASGLNYDLMELGAVISHPVGPFDIAAEAIFTPENSGDAGEALYVALSAGRQLTESVSLSGHVGRQWNQREEIAGPDYHDWGVALRMMRGRYNAILRFADSDNDSCADLCDARLIGEVGISF